MTQKIIKHMGTALEGEELEALKGLAQSVKNRIESSGQLPLYRGEEHYSTR